MMDFMLGKKELCRKLTKIKEKSRLPYKLFGYVIGQKAPNVWKKFHGKLPWKYEEIVKLSEFLEMPDLVQGVQTGRRMAEMEPTARLLAETVTQLPADLKVHFYRMCIFFFGSHFDRLKENEKLKLLEACFPPLRDLVGDPVGLAGASPVDGTPKGDREERETTGPRKKSP
jgi:hypothetical protein